MTWNKENIQYRISFSQSDTVGRHAPVRTRSTVKFTQHSKTSRRKYEYKRRQSTQPRYSSQQSQWQDNPRSAGEVPVNDDSQPVNEVDPVASAPAVVNSPILKRRITLSRTPAFRKPSRPRKVAPGPLQITVPVEQHAGIQDSDSNVEDEENETYQLRYRNASIKTTADMKHSVDPSQVTIEIADSVDEVERQLHVLQSLKTNSSYEEQEEVREEVIHDQSNLSETHHATSPVATISKGSVLSTCTNDSGISSLNTSRESTQSCATTDAGSFDSLYLQRQPHSAARKQRSLRGRVRVRRRPRKILVVGDMCSGKSNIVSAYCRDRFSESYLPTILNCCFSDAEVFGEKIELVLVDVSGRDDHKRLRECAYKKVDAVILCYSIANVASIDNILRKWIPELKHHANKVPYILVGTKKDLRDDVLFECEREPSAYHQLRDCMVSTERGEELAKEIGAQSFHECSALYREGTRDVFETVTKVALRKSRRKRKAQENSPTTCTIL